jgi:uncharacterized protein (TIGR02147 family)
MSEKSAAYRQILQTEFKCRARKNKRYSIRAYAKTLKISPSHLSRILGGKRGLSLSLAESFADRLQFPDDKKQYFCDLVAAAHSRRPEQQKSAKARVSTYRAKRERYLPLDVLNAVSDWYHGAIRQLALVDDFKSDPAWIAERLGIGVPVAQEAIERLIRLGLMVRAADGTLKTEESTAIHKADGIPSEAVRKFHSQILEKASGALHAQSISERYIASNLMPFSGADLPDAFDELHKFRTSFSDNFTSEKKDFVYCLAVQFFKLDRRNEKEGKTG